MQVLVASRSRGMLTWWYLLSGVWSSYPDIAFGDFLDCMWGDVYCLVSCFNTVNFYSVFETTQFTTDHNSYLNLNITPSYLELLQVTVSYHNHSRLPHNIKLQHPLACVDLTLPSTFCRLCATSFSVHSSSSLYCMSLYVSAQLAIIRCSDIQYTEDDEWILTDVARRRQKLDF
jgi:hypothetical protein